MTNASKAREIVADYEAALCLEYDRTAAEIAERIYANNIVPKAKCGGRTAFVEISARVEVGKRLLKIIADAGYTWNTNAKELRGWLSW